MPLAASASSSDAFSLAGPLDDEWHALPFKGAALVRIAPTAGTVEVSSFRCDRSPQMASFDALIDSNGCAKANLLRRAGFSDPVQSVEGKNGRSGEPELIRSFTDACWS